MTSHDSSRRDFLTGRAVARSARDAVDRALDGDNATGALTGATSGESTRDSYLLQYSARAMACEFEVTVPASPEHPGGDAGPTGADDAAQPDRAPHNQNTPATLEALQLVEQLERQLTVYQPTSELSRINRQAAEGPVIVEPKLFALLQQCQKLSEETDGTFDITSTPLTRVWGFFRREGKLPDDAALEQARSIVGFQHVMLDAEASTVQFARPGIELNLGAIGKGYALDRCGELMRQHNASCFLWHAGQSSVLACGDQPGQGRGQGWPIEIGNPLKPGQPLATLRVCDAGLGTSGSGQQFFRHAGKRYGHVIDPRTGQPVAGVLSVTVLAPTAAEADALSTAFYILGPERAEAYCRAHAGCGFVMLGRNGNTQSGETGPVSLRTAGLSDEQIIFA